MSNLLTAQLNVVSKKTTGIKNLSDLRIGIPYEIHEFSRIDTRFGETIVALLSPRHIGYTYEPMKVFLPKRFTICFTDQVIEEYNSNNNPISMIYHGLRNGKHDIEFV